MHNCILVWVFFFAWEESIAFCFWAKFGFWWERWIIERMGLESNWSALLSSYALSRLLTCRSGKSRLFSSPSQCTFTFSAINSCQSPIFLVWQDFFGRARELVIDIYIKKNEFLCNRIPRSTKGLSQFHLSAKFKAALKMVSGRKN